MDPANVTPVCAPPRLPPRPVDGHKGLFGRVLVVAGSSGMSGAAVLAGTAALRAGAGLVQVATPADAHPVVAAGFPCYTTIAIRQNPDGSLVSDAAEQLREAGRLADVIAVGPGLGHLPGVGRLVRGLLKTLPGRPFVIDADGLNVLSPFTEEFAERGEELILTPHPGEFARLTGQPVPRTQPDRVAAAVAFAKRFGVVLLLKGANTVVTDGGGVYVNSTGNPGMATGGVGDVLPGVVAARVGQNLGAFGAAALGAWVHGRAGDHAAADLGQTALTAADLLSYLPAAFRDAEGR
jgi:NAD(P)H-hydrate epimerase